MTKKKKTNFVTTARYTAKNKPIVEVYGKDKHRIGGTEVVDRTLTALLFVTLGFFVGLVVTWQPMLLEQVHEKWNHLRVYEDGSYKGESKTGEPISGCINGALCEN